MKKSKRKKPDSETEDLSPLEAKFHRMARRHHEAHERQMKRLKKLGMGGKQLVLIAACAVALLCAAAIVSAANASSGFSAPALFNDGNEAQRAGRAGQAILNYERARLLAPGDEAIEQNLRMAREKAGVSVPAVPIWQRPAHLLSLDGLAGLASVSLLIFTLLFFAERHIPQQYRRLARGAAGTLGAVTLLASAAIAFRWPEMDRAVIIGSHPIAHIAPAADAATSLELKPGAMVTAEDSYGDFIRIRTEDGRAGWIPRADVERIIPAAS
jgi:hypothetical protein